MARLGRLACPEPAEGNSRPTDSGPRPVPYGAGLRPKVSPAARELLARGTGAREKNIEVLVARRFKRWGMRWTRRRAQALLKLRLGILCHGEIWFEASNSRNHN